MVEHVEGRAAPAVDRVLDRRLEPVTQVHDELRLVDPRHIAWAQLDVVRLLPRARQIDDVDAGAADLARCIGERIERRDDRLVAAGAARATATGDKIVAPTTAHKRTILESIAGGG